MMRVLGLMSGTSLDGIDAAILETDGTCIQAFGPAATFPYLAAEKQAIQTAIADALRAPFDDHFARPQSFVAAEDAITTAHLRVVKAMREDHDVGALDLIGFHGQTVLHRPDKKLTIQLGDCKALARQTGVDVVGDFRTQDVALGGQGAPLVPIYHKALLARQPFDGPVAVLNIGGVANVTYCDGDWLVAFDTGTGNGLLDQWMVARGLGEFDKDGALASSGHVDERVLSYMMAHPFFSAMVPKSLDRYDFSCTAVDHLSNADGAATLAAFCAEAVKRAIDFLPSKPTLWVVCGGGRKNRAIMAELEARTGAKCINADSIDWRGDDVEAEAFAYLAARSVKGLPLSFPGTTGVDQPALGGTLYKALP